MGSVGNKFTAEFDAEMVRMYGPEALARWNAASAPLDPASIGPLSAAAALAAELDEVPGGDDLDEAVDETAAGPVSQNEGGD